jgi:hypothetical protein
MRKIIQGTITNNHLQRRQIFMARNYRYISADSHFESPPEQWTHRVAKQYRDLSWP